MADNRDIVGRMLKQVKRKAAAERKLKEQKKKRNQREVNSFKGRNLRETLANRKRYLDNL